MREVGCLVQVHINGTLAHTVRSPNGRRIFVSAHPGVNIVELVVLDIRGEQTGQTASFEMEVSHHQDFDQPPALTSAGSQAAGSGALDDPFRSQEVTASKTDRIASADNNWEWVLSCPAPAQDSDANCRRRPEGEAPSSQESVVCSGHGVCRSSSGGSYLHKNDDSMPGAAVCLCQGDWFGEHCEHSVMFSQRFLPKTDPAHSAARCHQAHHRHLPIASWLQKIETNAHLPLCSPASAFLQEFSGTRGLGITWRWLSLAFSTALMQGKTFVVGGSWPWFDFAGCQRGVWCYLAPLSNCSGALVREQLVRLGESQPEGVHESGVDANKHVFREDDLLHLHADTRRELAALKRQGPWDGPTAESGGPGMRRPPNGAHDNGMQGAAASVEDDEVTSVENEKQYSHGPWSASNRSRWVDGLDLEGQVPQVLIVGIADSAVITKCCCGDGSRPIHTFSAIVIMPPV